MQQNIAIFASGTGTNAQRLISHFKTSDLASVALVVSNKKSAGVLRIAEAEHIPTLVINKEMLYDPSFLLLHLSRKKIDLIVLAGFLLKIPQFLIRQYPDKIINIHPALLPKYGGRGMYGHHVHAAVIDHGEIESGITIHFINENYDEGKIILQKKCAVRPEDDAKSLAQKVQQLEHRWFPVAVEKIIRENLKD